jgi:hypothetical protein
MTNIKLHSLVLEKLFADWVKETSPAMKQLDLMVDFKIVKEKINYHMKTSILTSHMILYLSVINKYFLFRQFTPAMHNSKISIIRWITKIMLQRVSIWTK